VAYEVKIEIFEGPLDLLLQLITRRKVDISEVRLTDIVHAYLGYLGEMREMDLDIASEFLLMAATLIHLKARNLLPDDRDIDLDDDLALLEERDRLLSRLLACVTFKDVAAVLAHRIGGNRRYIGRTTGIDQDLPPPKVSARLDLEPSEFARLAARVLAPRHLDLDLDHLDLELPSVDEAILDLRIRVGQELESTFDELVEHCTRDVDIVAYFLALLELARWGAIEVAQTDWLSGIEVRHRSDAQLGHLASEWS
jgi:segregation and condensation protein A